MAAKKKTFDAIAASRVVSGDPHGYGVAKDFVRPEPVEGYAFDISLDRARVLQDVVEICVLGSGIRDQAA